MAGELQTLQAPPANSPKYHRITPAQRKVMRELRQLNTSQTAIAEVLGVSQGTVSKWLAETEDTTTDATEYLRAKALRMAENVVKRGQARDHIQALKGIGVLEQDQTQLNIAVGVSLPGLSGEGLSPVVSVQSGEGVQNP